MIGAAGSAGFAFAGIYCSTRSLPAGPYSGTHSGHHAGEGLLAKRLQPLPLMR